MYTRYTQQNDLGKLETMIFNNPAHVHIYTYQLLTWTYMITHYNINKYLPHINTS